MLSTSDSPSRTGSDTGGRGRPRKESKDLLRGFDVFGKLRRRQGSSVCDSGRHVRSTRSGCSSSPMRVGSERRFSLLRRHAPSRAGTGAGDRLRAPQSVATMPFKVDELRGITTAAAHAAVPGAVAGAVAGITSSARFALQWSLLTELRRLSFAFFCLTIHPVTACWTRSKRLVYRRSTFYNRRFLSFVDR